MNRPLYFTSIVTALGLSLALLTALISEQFFNLTPCELCLAERWPYYIGAPLAMAAACFAFYGQRLGLQRLAVMLLLCVLAWGLFLGIHHSGVEFGWWPAPELCRSLGLQARRAGDLLSQLQPITPCDAPSFRLFGLLSFANMNVLLIGACIVMTSAALYRSRTTK